MSNRLIKRSHTATKATWKEGSEAMSISAPDCSGFKTESYKGPSVSAALRTEAACAPLRTEAMCETAGPGFRLKSVIFKENLSVSVKAPVVKKARVVKKSHRRLRPFAWD
jgi:hypothetical protein